MRNAFSFRTLLTLSFWIVLVLSLLLPSWYYYRTLTDHVILEALRNAFQRLNTIEWMLGQRGEFRSAEDLQGWLTELGKRESLRITYMRRDGQAIADSETPFAEIPDLENYASRTEIIQSQKQEVGVVIRYSRVTQKEQVFAAKSASIKGLDLDGFLRVAVPFSGFKDLLTRLRNVFLIIIALVFTATILLSRLLVRQLGHPIRKMIGAVEAIGNRSYVSRLRFLPGQEFYALAQSLNRMAERIENHTSSITKQVNRLEAVFNGMREGVMVLDSKGRIQSINRAFSELISNVPRPVGRRPLEVIMNLELQEACDKVLALAGKPEKKPYNLQIELGGGKVYDVSLVRLQGAQKELGAIVVFHDISQLKRLERVRQDFVANVSHELHTPLTSIKGYTETLLSEEEHDPERTVSFLQVILKSTNHMVKIVNELLQLARLEAGRTKIALRPVNVNDALYAAWKACLPLAEKKETWLDNQLPEEEVWVSAEYDQLVQVFRNLLENAVRYSPPGKPVSVSYRAEGNETTFTVYDEGPGIPRQHQNRIFERFYRAEKHRGGFAGSTGLGLAICRHIVLNHGGRIWVDSPDNVTKKGTSVYFTLLPASDETLDSDEHGEPLGGVPGSSVPTA